MVIEDEKIRYARKSYQLRVLCNYFTLFNGVIRLSNSNKYDHKVRK